MSIGLATFSNKLTISSSATVKPNEEEYKVIIYGFIGSDSDYKNINSIEELLSKYSSQTYSIPMTKIDILNSGVTAGEVIASPAIIDNNAFKIKNISTSFVATTPEAIINASGYAFFIRNEGAYDVYFSIKNYEDGLPRTCTAVDQTKQDAVDEYCSYVQLLAYPDSISFSESEGMTTEEIDNSQGFYKIAPDECIKLNLIIVFNSQTPVSETGEFTVDFEDFLIEFSEVAPEETS